MMIQMETQVQMINLVVATNVYQVIQVVVMVYLMIKSPVVLLDQIYVVPLFR